jgi:tetratricopeptide (TPR) repeat protein
VRLAPQCSRFYDARGHGYNAQGEFDKAIRDFTEALRLDPDNVIALVNRGIAYAKKGDLSQAITDYSEATRLQPDFHSPYFYRGIGHEKKGDWKNALNDYKEAIRLKPSFAEGYNGVAWLLATWPTASARDGEKAVEAATKACELTQWKSWSYIDTLAAAYAEAGDFAQAIKYQRQAMSMEGVKPEDRSKEQQRLGLYQQKMAWHEPLKQ